MPQDISVAALEKLRDFMSRQLGMGLEPGIEAFGADLERHLLALMRAATVKMNAMARVIESKEAVAAHHHAQLANLSEARDTLESERQANAELTEENQRLREQVYTYPPSNFSPDGQTWKQVAELQASRLAESANVERVLDWIRSGAKSAVLSFTEGPERQVAYAVEDDRRRRRGDEVLHPLARDAKTVDFREFGLSPGLTVFVRVSREDERAVLTRREAEETDPEAASRERMDNLVGAFREHLSRRDLRWLLERIIAEIEDRYAGLHRVPDLRAAQERLGNLVGNGQPGKPSALR